jgi:hypothetical protein
MREEGNRTNPLMYSGIINFKCEYAASCMRITGNLIQEMRVNSKSIEGFVWFTSGE